MKGLKTGGRVAGTPNRKTLARLALVQAAASASPLEFLLAIMRSNSPLIDIKTRNCGPLLSSEGWRGEAAGPQACRGGALHSRIGPIAASANRAGSRNGG